MEDMPDVEVESEDIEEAMPMVDDETIDMDDIIGEDIKADPNIDYSSSKESDEGGFSVSQLNLF